jgi:hypothetical protein
MEELKELQAELAELSRQQNKAIQRATFLEWEASELAAYEGRAKRITLLRDRLFKIDPTSERIA